MAAAQQPEKVIVAADDKLAPDMGAIVEVAKEPAAQGDKVPSTSDWLDDAGEEIFPSVGPLGRPAPLEEDDDEDIPSVSDQANPATSRTASVEASTLPSRAASVEDRHHASTARTLSVPSRTASVEASEYGSEVGGRSMTPSRNRRRSSRTSDASSVFSLSSPAKMKFRAVLNISLSFFGTGMLSLPKGIATFETDETRDLLVAGLLCCVVAFFAGSGFHLLGYVCEQNKAGNYVEAWNQAVGQSPARWIVIFVLVYEQYVAVCVGCGMVLADSCVSLAAPLKKHLPDATHWLIGRFGVLLILSMLAYPIVLQKNFRRLMNLSILSTICFALVMFVIIIRYVDGSYAPGGQYWEFQQAALEEAVTFDGKEFPLLQIMILVSMLTNALSGHAAAPAICRELPLERAKRGQAPVPGVHDRNARMIACVVFGGFAGGGSITLGSMIFGYLLFGVASKGNVLENFHPDDPLGIAAKVIVTCGIFTVFPLKFKPLRDYFYRIFRLSPKNQWLFSAITAVQLAAIMGAACILTDLGFLQAIAGATSCIFVAYFAPALMMCFHTKKLLGRTFGITVAAWAIFCLITGLIAVLSKYE